MEHTKHFKPCDFLIFGAFGDLSRRKLIPSLYQLEKAGLLAPASRIIGVARRDVTPEAFVAKVRESLDTFVKETLDPAATDALLARCGYVNVDIADSTQYCRLQDVVDQNARVMVNYLAVSPSLYGNICLGLNQAGLVTPETRVVLEKPIGTDLESSKEINDAVARVFHENQVYRIDHYLGKETVLNLIALRFANSLFTTNWDHNTIDHIQITVAESVGIEGRWGYFDQSGQLRDMVQNHLMQILTLVAMEPPASLQADSIRSEKLKVLKALRPITLDNVNDKTVRGQYGAGFIEGRAVPGYLEEEGGNPHSATETFVAIRADIDNWRWAGVPFYLRTGKRMVNKRTEVLIYFKQQPHNIFRESYKQLPPNKLIIRLQPDEGVEIEMLNKVPGIDIGVRLQSTLLDLSFSQAFKGERIADAYERLMLEAMHGHQAMFIHRDEVEWSWKWIDSIQNAWAEQSAPIKIYPAGSWGPIAAHSLLAKDGREWAE
jgi:glucose-6-phosphate 1-dehydrogenase